jgi:hypothetical protein
LSDFFQPELELELEELQLLKLLEDGLPGSSSSAELAASLFWPWLEYGKRQGWISEPQCATHDGIPMTEAEELQWNDGEDPCQHIVRLWDDNPS